MRRLAPITSGAALVAVATVLFVILAPWTTGAREWLATPISASPSNHLAETTKWHGRLMVLAWAFVLPAALVIARYFKITPRQAWPARLDNPFWFVTHRRLGHVVAIVMSIALAFEIWHRGGDVTPWHSPHSVLGWLVVLLAWLQVIGSYQRGTHGGPVDPFTRRVKPEEEWPGDHFCMTRRRVVFERVHKSLGYGLAVLASAAILTGLAKADALRWMWLALVVWWGACAATLVVLQTRVRCIDTYQAIWGLDRSLPGYRREPIGVGIRRFTELDAGEAPWQRLPVRSAPGARQTRGEQRIPS